MAGTVVAVFEDRQDGEKAASALIDAGVTLNDVSVIRKGAAGEHGSALEDPSHSEVDHEEFLSHGIREVPQHDVSNPSHASDEIGPRAAVGIVTGSSLGALLVASAVFLPGIGPLVVAGPLAAMLIGSIAGGAAGGLTGAFTAGGVPEDTAQRYHEHVERGATLVAALSSTRDEGKIEDILIRYGGSEVSYIKRIEDTVQSLES